jgi:hypothetical protein
LFSSSAVFYSDSSPLHNHLLKDNFPSKLISGERKEKNGESFFLHSKKEKREKGEGDVM